MIIFAYIGLFAHFVSVSTHVSCRGLCQSCLFWGQVWLQLVDVTSKALGWAQVKQHHH